MYCADTPSVPRDPLVSGRGHTFALRVQHGRAWILYARVPARTHACATWRSLAYVTGIWPQVCKRSWTAGYNRDNCGLRVHERVPFARSAVAEDPNEVLRGFASRARRGARKTRKGEGRRGKRICRDRRHVEPLCRDSSCAMCVVCRKRDGARHTARLRRRCDPFL